MERSELIFKTLTALLAILSFSWGVWQYKTSKENDYRNTLFKQQYDIYSELLNITSEIVITPPDSTQSNSFKKAQTEFEHLYFGRMHLIQSDSVISKMVDFYKTMNNYKDFSRSIDQDSMRNADISLATTCKKSLQSTQQIYLKDQKPIE